MQIKGRAQIEAFLRRPRAEIEAVLLYGDDQGLVRERSRQLQKVLLGSEPEALRLTEMDEARLKDRPSALYEEAAQVSMFGGSKFIRVRTNDAVACAALKAYLAERDGGAPRPDALIVIEAGELRPTNALRKDAEGDERVAAIAAYGDDADALEALISDRVQAAGHVIESDAAARLATRLGADRGVSAQEIEKLLTYAGAGLGGNSPIRLEDVDAIVGDASAAEIDGLLDAVFSGDLLAADRLSARLMGDGEHPVRLVRAALSHVERIRTPMPSNVQFGPAAAARRHAQRWSEGKLARAHALLIEAELAVKSTGQPGEAIASRVFLMLAQAARR